MKHLLNFQDYSAAELLAILDKAQEIKAEPERFHDLLPRRSLAMLFQKTSTRTRVSFEVAMTELGGHAIHMDYQSSNFPLSDIGYEVAYLSRNVSCIMARLKRHADLLAIADASKVPVINGCCEMYHPCQALADVLTILEHTDKPLDQVRLTWLGVQNNVSNSLVEICHRLGIHLTLAVPPRDPAFDDPDHYPPEPQALLETSPNLRIEHDPGRGVEGADFVYTDTWINMELFNDPAHANMRAARMHRMMPYQLNRALLEGSTARIMHDMPIHDGYEIEAGLAHDPRSIIFEQAANRLHAQKGVLWFLCRQT